MAIIYYSNDILGAMTVDGNITNDRKKNSVSFFPISVAPKILNVSRDPSNFFGKWKLIKEYGPE